MPFVSGTEDVAAVTMHGVGNGSRIIVGLVDWGTGGFLGYKLPEGADIGFDFYLDSIITQHGSY